MKKVVFIMVVALTTLLSCKKAETGPAGPQGPKGDSGTNGVANIKSSVYISSSSEWVYNSTDKTQELTIVNSDITPGIVASGLVMVYLEVASGQYMALPISFQDVQYNFIYKQSLLKIAVGLSSGNIPGNPGTKTFKTVIVPAGMIKPGVNYNNYNEVVKAHEIN